MSRTLRAAFRLLTHEGLLVHQLHRGVLVPELDDDDLVNTPSVGHGRPPRPGMPNSKETAAAHRREPAERSSPSDFSTQTAHRVCAGGSRCPSTAG